MKSNQIKQPATASAPFGTSAFGHFHGATLVMRARGAKTQAVLGWAIPAYVLGTGAWSPPVS